ncbi:MAG: GMC family oxidoreductase [Myxococcales bacterium]|nr:GMC family oxidoreductase [Myxococcales bacterium]
MIRQGAELVREGRDVVERADVCVIGSGCGGASLAARLAEAGRSVVIVEQGGYYTKEDFDQRELNMLAKIDGGRGIHASDDVSVSLTYGNNVGGASVHYWADSYRTPPDRLLEWRDVFGMEGHSEEALAPHFEQIERDLNVHEATDAYANKMNLLVERGARALGWHVARVPQARKACRASGHCMQGCAYDAKQSQLVTYVPRAVAAGARLFSDCRAEQLVFRGRSVEALVCRVLDRATGRAAGPSVRVEARAFVSSAGGYGTPDFLLRQGLKSRLPSLGEHLFVNPCPMAHAIFDEDIIQWRNIPAAWGVEEFRLARYAGPRRVFGRPSNSRYLEGGYLFMPNQLQPGMLAAVLPGFGSRHGQLMRGLARLGGTICWIDDVEPGRISVDGGRRRIELPLSGGNGERLRDAWKKQAQLLFQVGAKQVLFGDADDTRIESAGQIDAAIGRLSIRPGRNVLAAPHPGGGARMGASAEGSVVGFDHRVHGLDNLYVSDPSVFPSPPSVDPSLTILAFSYVAAAAVDAQLG